ncbi:MAG: molybdopterin-dependent oxidoreductase [Pseudomonadales bacterium]
MPSHHQRICPICEAGCGLSVTADGQTVIAARGNGNDVFSRGHACPKGVALPQLHADPDRLRTPLIRRAGQFQPASWQEAFELIGTRLARIRERDGADAIAVYLGNPSAHNVGLGFGFGVLARALRTRHLFTAGSVDQLPKQLASLLMYGNDMAVAVPDIARTDCLIMLGANPVVSNGSLWMVPDIRGKLKSLRARGGELVVIDPRLTETAALADQHLPIRPGGDAWLLMTLIRAVHAAGRRPAPALAQRLAGYELLQQTVAEITLPLAAARCGLSEAAISALIERMLRARRPAVYGRVGTTLQRFGTLTSFLIDALNIALGALDQPGGAMFPEQPFADPNRLPGISQRATPYARYHSRVSGYPELLGQLPAACLAEEMETPGSGQIRALVTVAGNPIVSNPDSERLARAIRNLDFRVAIDIYRTETSELADVILPGTSPFEDSHYDTFLGGMTWRNVARYSAPLFPLTERPDEWRLMLGLTAAVLAGRAATETELDALEDETVRGSLLHWVTTPGSPLEGRDPEQLLPLIEPRRGAERLLDIGIRAGTWGDHFGSRPLRIEPASAKDEAPVVTGLTLAALRAHPHGIDLGPLNPGLDRVLLHEDGKIHCAPALILEEIERLGGTAAATAEDLLLIGRRNVQTNNSWLHNLPALARGRSRCVLEMHPDDAKARGISERDPVRITSSTATLVVNVRLTEELRPGVVCLPHGFSAGEAPAQALTAARARQTGSVNANALAAANDVDLPSATAALNGIAVRCERFAPSDTTPEPTDP